MPTGALCAILGVRLAILNRGNRMEANSVPMLVPDPLGAEGLTAFASRLRAGELSAEDVTRAYLARIELLNPKLDAFEHVAADAALHQARAVDALLAAGVDLGPLMGVPVAVKDLFAVDGFPAATAGSRLPVQDIIGSEGPFIHTLKRAGCVILGVTKTVECAFGASGINTVRGTPWNPWDPRVQRLPGGSSSGSAVAVASGLCAFAIGTDTGGSVRVPAALCGIFGLKTTVGVWPTQGVFPLSTTLDSIGLLTRNADDAAVAFSALSADVEKVAPAPVNGLRLARVRGYVEEDTDPMVAEAFETAVVRLQEAGVFIEDMPLPEAEEREWIVPIVLGTELIATLGRDRFEAYRAEMDPVVARRIEASLDVPADQYVRALRRLKQLADIARVRLSQVDGWVLPTCAVPPLPVECFTRADEGMVLAKRVTRCSQPGNILGLCGVNVPLTRHGALPVGLQLLCAPNAETQALSVAVTLETVLGSRLTPPLEPLFGKVP